MPDVLTDKKVTQEEAGRLMAPMELDLLSLFKVIQEDIITGIVDFEGTPEQYIEQVLNSLTGIGETGEMAIMKGKDMAKVTKTCKPRGGEKQQDFISRCISEEVSAGTPQDEAQGKCYGIWRQAKKSEARKALIKALNFIAKKMLKSIKKT